MRLAVCALSAVLLSGCSWLGSNGGHHGASYGSGGGAYGVNCASGQGGQYGFNQMSQQAAYGPGGACAGGAYGVAGQGYGMQGHGMQGYGAHGMQGHAMQGYGAQDMSAMQYGARAYGQQGYAPVTTLGADAAYGSALGGVYGQNVVGTQMANGQYVQGAAVQTVQGSPLYVAQPYPAYYGVQQQQLRGSYGYQYGQQYGAAGGNVGGAMPFGIELDGGTEFDVGGDVFTDKPIGPADDDPSTGLQVGAIDGISYGDAFGQAKSIGGTLGYDINRNTTLLGTVGYSQADGETINDYTTVESGTYAGTPPVFTPDGSGPRSLDIAFSDLEQISIEGGVRKYVGANPVFRPYVGATAGFIHNNDVDITQTFADDGTLYNQQEYIESGWNPTAAAVLGAEMAVGPRAAIGVESGIRWRDNMDTNLESEDRWSVPVKLRGRVAF